ncbi:MAG TPA: 4-carboxymuconolactone decarboxylase [Acidimicrobiia bacterium]|nr:4-carboxymuconolactone decarboxylase [Acidimicrobiia bacterium]
MSDYDKGMAKRREVLGDDHVDRATANTTDLDRDFQTWVTEKVWGDLWNRPGLGIRDRSLVTIAILAALGHDEVALHLNAAHNTGVTPEEIGEVLLHVATYAGVPAANHAFAIFKATYSEEK